MADAVDSKSTVGNNVGVQVPSPAPRISLVIFKNYRAFSCIIFYSPGIICDIMKLVRHQKPITTKFELLNMKGEKVWIAICETFWIVKKAC